MNHEMNGPNRLLVLDDDVTMRNMVADVMTAEGYEVVKTSRGLEAVARAAEGFFPVALVDICLPDISGIEVVERIKARTPETEIILFTGLPSLETSMSGIRLHVFDYLLKPFGLTELRNAIARAFAAWRAKEIERRRLAALTGEATALQGQVSTAKLALENALADSQILVGRSAAMAKVRSAIAEAALSEMTTLIRGESGTGKDVVARLIHKLSRRRGQDLIKVNCPAISETLFESEIFGHEAGSFTGALAAKPGRFEIADQSTIFLDEVGEVPLSQQPKLLQVLESKEFFRVGGNKTIRVDARILAATNAPLEEMIAQKRFRADLFYRLQECTIVLPPLRERPEDIPHLVEHFLRLFAEQIEMPVMTLPDYLMDKLTEYDWPGNVRELQAMVKRFCHSGNRSAFDQIFHPPFSMETEPEPEDEPDVSIIPVCNDKSLTEQLRDCERAIILDALNRAKWNRRVAAEQLGVGYSSLRRKIAQHKLDDPEEADETEGLDEEEAAFLRWNPAEIR